LHPVVKVNVQPGDRVKKDEVLVELDADEPRADVRAKKAALESAKATLAEARRHMGVAERLYGTGVMPEPNYHAAHTALLKAEQDERQAKANLEASEAELEHYTVTAQIDGVIAWLDVYLGTVSRPGTTIWGEILDLTEIDVRCELSPEQVGKVAVGQEAEVLNNGTDEPVGVARVVVVGIAADKTNSLIPVTVRLPNVKPQLRCEVPVRVRFRESSP
jgi:RND family efflux transporter MFP subunit